MKPKYAYKLKEDLFLVDDRPRTDIGPQADHVTAYGLFKEFVRSLEDNEPEEMVNRLLLVLCAIDSWHKQADNIFSIKTGTHIRATSDIQETFQKYKEFLEQFLPADKMDAVLKEISDPILRAKVKFSMLRSNQAVFDEMITFLSNCYLNIRNRQKYASFPREGNCTPLANEFTLVTQAVKNLRKFDVLLNDKKNNLDENSLKEVVRCMHDLFFYPKIPNHILMNLDTQASKRGWEIIKKQKRYNAHTMPRTNDFEILYFVAALHVDTIFQCFRNFNRNPDPQDAIIKQFVEKIASEWKMKPEETKVFLENVSQKLLEKKQDDTQLSIEISTYYSVASDHPSDLDDASMRSGFGNILNDDLSGSSSLLGLSPIQLRTPRYSKGQSDITPQRSLLLFSQSISGSSVFNPSQPTSEADIKTMTEEKLLILKGETEKEMMILQQQLQMINSTLEDKKSSDPRPGS